MKKVISSANLNFERESLNQINSYNKLQGSDLYRDLSPLKRSTTLERYSGTPDTSKIPGFRKLKLSLLKSRFLDPTQEDELLKNQFKSHYSSS